MKILIVAPYFYPKIGGVESYVYNISKGLNEKYGWKIVVITSNHVEKIDIIETIDGMKIYRLALLFKISNTPINPLWYFQVKKIIQKEKPNVINAHTPVPFISDLTARVCKNIPFILTYHNDISKENIVLNFICKLYYYYLGNKTLEMSDKIIVTSKDYARNSPYISKHLNKVRIIPPGVDISKYNPQLDNKYLLEKYGARPKVLFVGQLDKTHIHKGIYYLLDAISLVRKEVNDVLLLVVGKGDNIDNYKNYVQINSLEKNVIFTDFLSDLELAKYYCGSNVSVLPSYSSSEGFGMVLIEAGACGKPVIGTLVGGIPYVIDHNKNGLLVEPKNSKELADAIITILSNPKLAQKMGENGYKKVKDNFMWDKQVKNTNYIFKTIKR